MILADNFESEIMQGTLLLPQEFNESRDLVNAQVFRKQELAVEVNNIDNNFIRLISSINHIETVSGNGNKVILCCDDNTSASFDL